MIKKKRERKNFLNKCYLMWDIYKFYRQQDLEFDEKYKVDRVLFKKVISAYNSLLVEYIVDKGIEIPLFYGLGKWRIIKFKADFKKVRMDYNYYNQTGKWIPHVNLHSDNYCARFFWKKRDIRIVNQYYYGFKPSDIVCKRIAKNMKEFKGHNRYSRK